jgi:RNA polymerase sigma-70 factor (ECF subfamily)
VDRDDRELVRQCLQGDQDACTTVVEQYSAMVGTVIWRATGDHGAVEDLAQETFLRVFRGLGYFDARSKLSTWIYTIAHRVAIDHLRQVSPKADWKAEGFRLPIRGSRRPSALRSGLGEASNPETAAAHEELDRIVRGELSALPERYRLPLVYATLDELDYQTIAAMLKVKPGTVKTLVFRARQMLRERVEFVLAQRREGSHAT